MILKCFCVDIPALSAAVLNGVNHKTTQRIYSLLRERIVDMAIEESKPFVGDIEVDESYFGPRRVRGKRGRGASGKIPVLGLHKRQGRVFLSVVKNCSRAELMPILQGRIVEGSDVYTDGWKAYDGLVTNGYQHHRVHHHENEFARGKIMLTASFRAKQTHALSIIFLELCKVSYGKTSRIPEGKIPHSP